MIMFCVETHMRVLVCKNTLLCMVCGSNHKYSCLNICRLIVCMNRHDDDRKGHDLEVGACAVQICCASSHVIRTYE